MRLWPFGARASADGGKQIDTASALDEYLRASDEEVRVTPESSLRQAAAFRCTQIISGATATLPIAVKQRVDDRTRLTVSDHPVSYVLRRRPNRWQTPLEWRRLMQTHVLLRGNGYSLIVRSRGRVIELLPLDPNRMEVEQQDDLRLEYRYRRKAGDRIRLPEQDVFHLRGMTLDGVQGVSVISHAKATIEDALRAEQHGGNVFKNGTAIGAILEHPKNLSPEAQANLRDSLADFRGSSKSFKTLIAEEGLTFKPLGMTQEDAQYIETRKFHRSEIAMFFGVPPHMIGDTEKTTSWGTGIEQQGIGFVTYTLQDWLTAWEQTVNRDLIGDADPSLYCRINSDGLVRGDIKARWEAYVKGLQWGVFSPNDVREKEDENPREGGDIYYDPPNTAGGNDDDSTVAEDRSSEN